MSNGNLQEANYTWNILKKVRAFLFYQEKKSPEYYFDVVGGTMPVPFNIIPTPKNIYNVFCRIFLCKKKLKDDNEDTANSIDNPSNLTLRIKGPVPDLNRKKGKPAGVPAISNGQMGNLRLNEQDLRTRQGSFDVNQRLTYRKVMKRVTKRFLLHKQREEQEEIREGDFEELKQDIQMLRFEMLGRLDETRDDLSRNSHLLNEGVLIIGDLLNVFTQDSNPLIRDNFHLFKQGFYSRTDSGIESNKSTFSSTSISNLLQDMPSNKQEPDIDPTRAFRTLSVTSVALSRIIEVEEKDSLNNSIPYIDDDDDHVEEVPARHMSSQTSINRNNVRFSKF